MPSTTPRDRIVLFRLTQEEYQLLRDASAASGARSISDFTRSEILSVVQADSMDMSVWSRLVEIDRKLDGVLDTIERARSDGGPQVQGKTGLNLK